jgi:hypothetical protein
LDTKVCASRAARLEPARLRKVDLG